ncbi:nudC domain-containing protein 1-like [Dendronephthya gigantea]|uniref:nudC domain-containing protein 1-like n=1 Tax=Dendronephthya gigantea TaxID=151771 RepID=UPI00106DB87A|nr:nudC domain-containing protein 1-like [Dendronephthya gigantea]
MAANMDIQDLAASLRPNRELLNPKFDGYKLSPDQLAVEVSSLPEQVNTVRLKEDIFSHLHVKAFAWTNHLVLDNWTADNGRILLYFVDENFAVNQVTVKDNKVQEVYKTFNIPPANQGTPHNLNAYVAFPSKTHAVVSDGQGELYVIHTGNRLDKHTWKVAQMQSVGKPFSILHTNLEPTSSSLAAVLLSVTPDEDSGSFHVKHRVLLTVLVFAGEVGENGAVKFSFETQKEFQSHVVPLYGAIEPGNQKILVATEKPFFLVSDKDEDCPDQGFEDICSGTQEKYQQSTKDKASKLCNQEELEECDSLPEDVLYIVRMDLKDGRITQKTSLSTHQWLFTKMINPSEPPSFCIRHDVDALVWLPKEVDGQITWNHIGTLDAFGFVLASKKEQKFTSCSPDMSYAVICDVRNHIFTYHRHSKQDAVHAQQKLLQLDNVGSEGIIGVQACRDAVFVLAKEKIYVVSLF